MPADPTDNQPSDSPMTGAPGGRPNPARPRLERIDPAREEPVADFVLRGRVIAYHGCLAPVIGGAMPALLLSQFYYWSHHTAAERRGWFWKTQSEIQEETGMTRREQETARRILRDYGVLEEEKRGLPAKLYFRLNFSMLFELIRDHALRTGQPLPDAGGGTGGFPGRGASQPAHHAQPSGKPPKPSLRADVPAAPSKASSKAPSLHGASEQSRMADSAILVRQEPTILRGDSAHAFHKKTPPEDDTRRAITRGTTTTTRPALPTPGAASDGDGVVVASEVSRDSDLVALLCEKGVTRRNAQDLVRRHPAEVVLNQVEMLAHRRAADPAAVLVKAIEHEWAPPQAYLDSLEAAKAREAEEARRAAQRKAAEAQREVEAAEVQRAARLEEFWCGLDTVRRNEIEERVQRMLRERNPFLARSLDRNPAGPIVSAALRAIRHELLSEWVT